MKGERVIGAILAGALFLVGPAIAVSQITRTPLSADKLASQVAQDTLRDALVAVFASVLRPGTPRDFATTMSRARRIAKAYTKEQNDAFLNQQVTQFGRLSPALQRARARADSLRLAGNIALNRDGVAHAMALWRESYKSALATKDRASTAPVLVSIGAGFYRANQLDSARSYVTRGKSLATQIGDFRTTGNALGVLASISKERGDTSEAVDLYHAALVVRARSGDARGIAADENNLGLIARARGNHNEATRYFEDALAINRRDGRQSLAALNLANLASVAADIGDYSRADSLLRVALSIRRSTGDRAESAFVLEELGHLQTRRGNYIEAKATLLDALQIDAQSGAVLEATSIRQDLAQLESVTGHPDKALRIVGEAKRLSVLSPTSQQTLAGLTLVTGDLHSRVGNLQAAESDYGTAESLFRKARDAAGIANARYGHASVLYARGQTARASNMLSESFLAQMNSGDTRNAAITELLLAAVLRSQGDTTASLRSLDHARVIFSSLKDRVGEAAAIDLIGEAELSSERSAKAARLFRYGIARLGNRAANDVKWRLHAGLAEAMQMSGDLPGATSELQTSISLIERTANEIEKKPDRYGFLRDKWSVYVRLAMLEQSRGRSADAFAVSERLRARELVDMLARGPAQSQYPALVFARTVSAHEVESHLRPDEALVEYLVGDSSTSAFILTNDAIHEVSLPIGHQRLADLIEFSRRATEKPNGSASAALWRPPLQRLYRELISPIENKGYLANKRRLLIIPHAELHFLSFAALTPPEPPDRFLIEKFVVSYAPSATAWSAIADRKFRTPTSRVVAFAPQADKLPGARAEVRAIGEIYGSASMLRTGPQATKRALRAALADAGTLHLATYGVLNRRNPLSSYVKLAAETADDGKLEVSEVFGLPLEGQLVILSACETGLATGGDEDVPAGDDWVGLVHAFLQAGANTVVASLWPVDDAATSRLMQRFHRGVASGVSPSESLARAQRYALRSDSTKPPFFWAAFVSSGIQ